VSVLHVVFAPGLFTSAPVQTAALIGGVVAVVCAPAGLFTVMRGQSFAAHAFSDITSTGGSAAALAGVAPLVGFAATSLAGAGTMGALGVERQRGRDLVTGITLGAALGVTALLLYLATTQATTSGAAVTVLFGSVFAVSSAVWPTVVGFGVAALALVTLGWRPLLLSSVSPELAAAKGVHLRLLEMAYLAAVALAVALASLSVGAILSTALLVGPAAAGLRLARSPGRACLWAAGIGVFALWAGIVLAYDSYNWPPAGQGWPVSFFVVFVVLAAYLAAQLTARGGHRRRTRPPRPRGTARG
jgi:zinc/manganese transport system permease protein